jgi:glutaredoxin 3
VDEFTIGELARQAGVNVETLRYYERRQLLPRPPRSASGYRLYPQDAVRWVQFMKHAKAALAFRNSHTHGHGKEIGTMNTTRTIEVFSAGCPTCEETVALVQRAACPSSDVIVLDMRDPAVASRAMRLGVRSVPAVAIDGDLAGCCVGRSPDEASLRAAGVGQPN